MLEIYQLGLRFFGIIGGIIYFSGLFCLLANCAKHYINDEKYVFPKWFKKINIFDDGYDTEDYFLDLFLNISIYLLIFCGCLIFWFICIPIIIGYFILRLLRALVRIKKDINNIKIKTDVNISIKKENK